MRTLRFQLKDLPKSERPIIHFCRELLRQGECPQTRLEVYRDGSLDIIVKEIGLAAQLRVSDTRFKLDHRWIVKFKGDLAIKEAA
jgi:hypothetical protein